MRLILPLLGLLLGCGGSARSARAPAEPSFEHWETLTDHRYVYQGGCTIGPFELELPDRDDLQHGRRVAILVYGPRAVRFDSRVDGSASAGSTYSMTGSLFSNEGDHSRCRVAGGDQASASAVPPGSPATPGRPPAPAGPPTPHRPRVPERDTPSTEWPKLVTYDGELPGEHVQASGQAWLPHGIPWYVSDEYGTWRSASRDGMKTFRIRFWSDRLQNLDGVIFRVLDQKLVPDLPLDAWLVRYKQRVAAADAQREVKQPQQRKEIDEWSARCSADRSAPACENFGRTTGRVPPPPRVESPPRAPSRNVDWIPGYWVFETALDDFVWIPGTFVVRAAKPTIVAHVPAAPIEPTAPAAAPPGPVAPVAEPAPPATAEPARTIDDRVEPPPPPAVEAMPPPPSIAGVIWVPGYWQLVGTRWQWTAGRWIQPPSGHAYRVPVIQRRGAVRVYVPGGWIRRR